MSIYGVPDLEPIVAALNASGWKAQAFPADEYVRIAYINVWTPENRLRSIPDDTVWPPDERINSDVWEWGPNYQFSASRSSTDGYLVSQIQKTVKPR